MESVLETTQTFGWWPAAAGTAVSWVLASAPPVVGHVGQGRPHS